MKTDLQTIAITSGQHASMRLPELVEGVTGSVTVVVDENALRDAQAIVKMTLEIEVLPSDSL